MLVDDTSVLPSCVQHARLLDQLSIPGSSGELIEALLLDAGRGIRHFRYPDLSCFMISAAISSPDQGHRGSYLTRPLEDAVASREDTPSRYYRGLNN